MRSVAPCSVNSKPSKPPKWYDRRFSHRHTQFVYHSCMKIDVIVTGRETYTPHMPHSQSKQQSSPHTQISRLCLIGKKKILCLIGKKKHTCRKTSIPLKCISKARHRPVPRLKSHTSTRAPFPLRARHACRLSASATNTTWARAYTNWSKSSRTARWSAETCAQRSACGAYRPKCRFPRRRRRKSWIT